MNEHISPFQGDFHGNVHRVISMLSTPETLFQSWNFQQSPGRATVRLAQWVGCGKYQTNTVRLTATVELLGRPLIE